MSKADGWLDLHQQLHSEVPAQGPEVALQHAVCWHHTGDRGPLHGGTISDRLPKTCTVQTQYQECSDRYQEKLKQIQTDQSQGSSPSSPDKVGLLCCSFQEYLDCSQHVVNNTCGFHTASFTKGFLDRMAKPLAKGHCQSYPSGSYHCQETTTHSSVFSTVFMSSSVAITSTTHVLCIVICALLVILEKC